MKFNENMNVAGLKNEIDFSFSRKKRRNTYRGLIGGFRFKFKIK